MTLKCNGENQWHTINRLPPNTIIPPNFIGDLCRPGATIRAPTTLEAFEAMQQRFFEHADDASSMCSGSTSLRSGSVRSGRTASVRSGYSSASSIRPRTVASNSATSRVSLESIPSLSSKDMGSKEHREELKKRREAILEQAAQIKAALREEDHVPLPPVPPTPLPPTPKASVTLPEEKPPTEARRSKSQPAKLRSGVPRPSRKQKMPTWTLPSTANLPTFQSHAVWNAMTYLNFDGNGLVAEPKLGK
mmetsp:Transcript_9938/g.25687  ORF Transcript_9938/g.25687 Transcript_9938/m.25687 type:complete len:248 (-) Transcript_9938:307-1050(-)